MINCTDRFKDWPQQLRQSPFDLVCNGFFYEGVADRVIYFMCVVILKSWEFEDVIVHEHKKWSKDCAYLKLTIPRQSNGYIPTTITNLLQRTNRRGSA